MQTGMTICHGGFDCLAGCAAARLGVVDKFRWHVKTKGFRTAIRLTAAKALRLARLTRRKAAAEPPGKMQTSSHDEVLNLKPGELVDVRSEEQIAATLDRQGRHKGLYWMPSMQKFCGERFRVYKRVERIMLESTGQFKKVRNTVLLEGVMCDGRDFYGCDRSCFHFWREVWLKRV